MPLFLVIQQIEGRDLRDCPQAFYHLVEDDAHQAALCAGWDSSVVVNLDAAKRVTVSKEVTLVADDGETVVHKTQEEVNEFQFVTPEAEVSEPSVEG